MTLTMGSLFSGIGGFERAAAARGIETIWQSEIDPDCAHYLSESFPGVPNLGDICTIDWNTVERPDIVCGGFPCQDISIAGRGAGLAGARSGLWFEFARCLRDLGPRYAVVENVRRLLTIHGGRDFGTVLGTLAELGYDVEWSVYGASDVGAKHERQRVWMLAYADRGLGKPAHEAVCAGRIATDACCASVGDPVRARSAAWLPGPYHWKEGDAGERDHGGGVLGWGDAVAVEGFDGSVRYVPADCAERGPESPLWPVAHGVPARAARLRAIGNAVVPACALPIFDRILELERGVA